MSSENLESFRRGAEALSRGDIEASLDVIDPEVVFEPLRAATEGAFIGHDGIRRFWADTTATFELFEWTFTDVRDLGECILAVGTIRVRGRGSGIETDIPTAQVAEYRNGLLWRYKDYGDERAALEAIRTRAQ